MPKKELDVAEQIQKHMDEIVDLMVKNKIDRFMMVSDFIFTIDMYQHRKYNIIKENIKCLD